MVILIIPYYTEHNIVRKDELDLCLSQNISNRLIDKIILVCDETVPDTISMPFDKVIMHRLGKRASFSDLFYRVAPIYVDQDDIVIVANSDIHFNDTLSKLSYVDWDKGIALSVSRWDRACNMAALMPDELKESREYVVYPQRDSQDFWIFKGEIKGMYSEFYLGIPGCDNRITFEMDRAGYWVFNPAKDIIGLHVHDSGMRTYVSKGQRVVEAVPQPYKFLFPTDLSPLKMKPKKKIFHLGLYSFAAERAIGEGLNVLGEYKFLDWQRYCNNWILIPELIAKFEEDVLKLVGWADYVFMQLQTPNIISKELILKMKAINPRAVIYNWTGDVRDPIPPEMIDIAPEVISLFTNDTDVKTMLKKGFRSKYLQIGFPEHTYNPKGYVRNDVPDIVFMANNYYDKKLGKHLFPNGKARQDMVMFLKETYGDRFGVYGSGWHELMTEDFRADQVAEATVYRSTKIAINYSHFDYERYSSDRLLRIMGSGCFCITHNFPRIEEDYVIGKHLAVFDTFEQLKIEIDTFLADDLLRNNIAKEGCAFVHKTAPWAKRLGGLFNNEIKI